ncbi:putative RNA-directed DNA polymerase [Medicago truncatula]|uniref:Putative RNA-directed DNA polymerase n=1 Tax=Medicago truncatula TaxID=3880 RepID=A0A396HP87_MEDTR|nr:putative RNA-directed DNA polymerase [Medicago truncatula]
MDIPPGYTVPSGDRTVCRLQRALYGLKQSPRAWFGRFSMAMKKYGFCYTLFLDLEILGPISFQTLSIIRFQPYSSNCLCLAVFSITILPMFSCIKPFEMSLLVL